MMHPHEDLNLSQQEYINIVRILAMGGDTCKEKIDGFGLHVTYEKIDGVIEARLVRSKADHEAHGVRAIDVDKRMAHNPEAAELYKIALRGMNDWADAHEVQLWPATYNCEVLKPGITNLINYGEGYKVIVHNVWDEGGIHGVLDWYYDSGDYIVSTTPELTINGMTEAEVSMWTNRIYDLLHDYETVGDFYKHSMRTAICGSIEGKDFDILVDDVFNYVFKMEGRKNLKVLKKEHPEFNWDKQLLNTLYLNTVDTLDRFDLEFGTAVLLTAYRDNFLGATKNMPCSHVGDAYGLKDVIDERDYNRWRTCKFRAYNLEGIVFGKYKFTGPFGPLNQIYGKLKRNA